MAIRTLSETGSRTTSIQASVCVVGGGIAGLMAAARLARDRTRRVVVVESGLKKLDPASETLNEIDHLSTRYQKPTVRFRGLGGNSLLWDGKLLPLSPHDTAGRPYLGLPAWPFDVAELEAYRDEIESLFGVDRKPYEEDVTPQLDPRALLPRNADELAIRWAKRPAPKNKNLAHVFRAEIATHDNLEIWLGATASEFAFDPATGRISALTAVNLEGQSLTVVADEYLIAAGTLESTRLLLLADRQSNGVISRDGNALGHYFNDHLGLIVANLVPVDWTRTNQMLGDRWLDSGGRHLHLELKRDVQEKEGVPSAYADFEFELPDASSLTKSRQIVERLKQRKFGLGPRDLQAIVADLPSLFWTVQWKLMRKHKYWPPNAIPQMKIWIEQTPQWQNRLSLSDRQDALQLPMLKLDWDKSDLEEKTFRAAVAQIDRYWKRHLTEVCRLEWKPMVSTAGTRLVDESTDLAHPAGSTRMGTSPTDSVVDPQLKVHRVPNLSVASASTFPSSGSANPTLAIIQLALRAADALNRRLPG